MLRSNADLVAALDATVQLDRALGPDLNMRKSYRAVAAQPAARALEQAMHTNKEVQEAWG